ncbi:uncharacterized protein LOC119684369 [Teleopsis dalmanni]|uniref:uncharacterized protein LOC119682984 n=1 Tax=Teleopsis dalmanni TaxID=139649 RepID=UPI0018CD9635|nr:uncharacterized protein LOC119682984 [Teleopsis dalmanni]XP_037954324.1 uncharacterized protein LOC119684369 [Teleopsis dalmanni]
MKFFLCFVVLATVVFVTVSATDGRSGCRDPIEVGETYPHHFDHAKYWYCETLDVPATEMQCPHGLAYMHLLKECIPWDNWVWKQPENPPTLA